MSSFNIFYLNDINRLQAFCFGVEASVEALHLTTQCFLRKLAYRCDAKFIWPTLFACKEF
ncbi:MAG: hypothetical protein RL739_959 [Pseudomonadota bacterium]|jgi:hypothetical protein